MSPVSHPAADLRPALVIFEDRAARGPLRCLERGFRHCFCIVEHRLGWLVCDLLKSGMAIELIEAYGTEELARHLLMQGRRHVLVGAAQPAVCERLPLLRPLTCVEIVKRLLGISHGGVWTPRQLYRFLLARQGWQVASIDDARTVDSAQ